MNFLEFYDRNSSYYEFSNFYPSPIQLDDQEWPTTEHYFQASKFIQSPWYASIVREADTPHKAFVLARQSAPGYKSDWSLNKKDSRRIGDLVKESKDSGVRLRSDWTKVRYEIMLKAVRAKFTQHQNLREILIRTGKSTLIENAPRDRYWGNGGYSGNGVPQSEGGTMGGENKLGQILMKVREELS